MGCGTGSMLHRARDRGHAGRLVDLDADRAALARARAPHRRRVLQGTAANAWWRGEFELATMVSHAFQCLVTDDELRASLIATGTALCDH